MKRRRNLNSEPNLSSHNGGGKRSGLLAPIVNTASDLPLDLLESIFKSFPLFSRVGVVSLVCQRWRRAVFRTITELPSMHLHGEPFMRNFRLFPNLTSLVMLDIACDFELPPRLQHVKLVAWHADCQKQCATARLFAASITTLTLRRSRCRNAGALALHCRSSLTMLDLNDHGESADYEYFPYDQYFSALRTLHLNDTCVNEPTDARTLFLIRHAAQLTSVTAARLPEYIDLPLCNRNWFAPCSMQMPLGSAATVCDPARLSDIILTVDTTLWSSLQAFANLTRLTLRLGAADNCLQRNSIATLTCATSLNSLTVDCLSLSNNWPIVSLGYLPALTYLSGPYRWHINRGDLPQLRTFCISASLDVTSFAVAAEYFEQCLIAVPSLERLELFTHSYNGGWQWPRMLKFLRKCEAAGVQEVVLDQHTREQLTDHDLAEFKWTRVRRGQLAHRDLSCSTLNTR